jgi:transposase
MEVIVERLAALDVHNASVMTCVRAPGDGRRRAEHVAEFQTTVQGLLTPRDWLEAHEVDQVAMEATGVDWKPVWAVLEDRFRYVLVNARHVRQVRGRKSDVMTPNGSASCSKRGCCARAWCRRSRSAGSGI